MVGRFMLAMLITSAFTLSGCSGKFSMKEPEIKPGAIKPEDQKVEPKETPQIPTETEAQKKTPPSESPPAADTPAPAEQPAPGPTPDTAVTPAPAQAPGQAPAPAPTQVTTPAPATNPAPSDAKTEKPEKTDPQTIEERKKNLTEEEKKFLKEDGIDPERITNIFDQRKDKDKERAKDNATPPDQKMSDDEANQAIAKLGASSEIVRKMLAEKEKAEKRAEADKQDAPPKPATEVPKEAQKPIQPVEQQKDESQKTCEEEKPKPDGKSDGKDAFSYDMCKEDTFDPNNAAHKVLLCAVEPPNPEETSVFKYNFVNSIKKPADILAMIITISCKLKKMTKDPGYQSLSMDKLSGQHERFYTLNMAPGRVKNCVLKKMTNDCRYYDEPGPAACPKIVEKFNLAKAKAERDNQKNADEGYNQCLQRSELEEKRCFTLAEKSEKKAEYLKHCEGIVETNKKYCPQIKEKLLQFVPSWTGFIGQLSYMGYLSLDTDICADEKTGSCDKVAFDMKNLEPLKGHLKFLMFRSDLADTNRFKEFCQKK